MLPLEEALAKPPDVGTYVTIPEVVSKADGESQSAERGLFFVPENRAKRGGRVIPVHFLRFPAVDNTAGRFPVFLLPGGPGSEWDFSEADNFETAKRYRQTRDVVYVSQRGNPRAPNLVPDLYISEVGPRPLDEPGSAERDSRAMREAVRKVQKAWTEKGVDLAGYDIVNIVDDVHELRAALGYDKIVLRACSFGSQWSLAYMKRWPGTVDRALLSGVEPLDYAYDSPKWLWASMSRLAASAEADTHLAPFLPSDGLMEAFKEIVERLEKKPVTVVIADPDGNKHEVSVGPHDLMTAIRHSFGESRRESFANWPRYILEMHGGDYRYLAALAWQARSRGGRTTMIGYLIDNSLGITAGRDKKLLDEPEARWLGDINAWYRDTRDLTPTPVVDDDFRANWPIDVPVLLVNGDLDWSTPLENAQTFLRSLEQGHLVTVKGGGHCPIGVELAELMPEAAEEIRSFVDADFLTGSAAGFFETLPDEISLPPFEFSRPVGPSLYDQWLASNRD
jgi:pimeloyl-ACP methyl ester carboxylesterase